MTRALTIQGGVGLFFGAVGLVLLLRPGVGRALFRADDSDRTDYAIRILGAMCFAAGLLLVGFVFAFTMAVQP